MKLWKSMLAMLLCSGLIIAFGLTACGDDDDDEPDCVGALTQLQTPDCLNGIIAGIDVFRTCMAGCQGDPICEEGCEDDFEAAGAACEPAATTLAEECGCDVCGNSFESCIAGQTPAADCVDVILACFVDCVT